MLLSPATGEMAETVPSTVVSSALIVTDAVWPTLMFARSLSTTSVETSKVVEETTIAGPAGASKPAVMLTAVTVPAMGALRVAALILSWIAWRASVACECWFCAAYSPSLAWRSVSVVVAASSVSWAIASWIWAERRSSVADASWRWRSAVSAVASTSPAATVSPTVTFTFLTGQVTSDAGASPAATTYGSAPKTSP